jgi:hypothetical protein
MKYCTHCGTQCADEAAFCSKCGKELCDPAAAIPELSDPPEPPKPAPPKPFYKRLLTLSIFVSVIIIILYSINTSYENYDEAEYFEEHYQDRCMDEVTRRFEEDGYTVTGFTVPDNWTLINRDGEYIVFFVTEAEKGIAGRKKYWCNLTFEFSGYKDFYLTDISIEPYYLG